MHRVRPVSIYDVFKDPPKKCAICGFRRALLEQCVRCGGVINAR